MTPNRHYKLNAAEGSLEIREIKPDAHPEQSAEIRRMLLTGTPDALPNFVIASPKDEGFPEKISAVVEVRDGHLCFEITRGGRLAARGWVVWKRDPRSLGIWDILRQDDILPKEHAASGPGNLWVLSMTESGMAGATPREAGRLADFETMLAHAAAGID